MPPSFPKRYIQSLVQEDLKKKMVFISGPRQVGKTTLATQLRPEHQTTYLNWDHDEDRTQIINRSLGDTPLLVLDEIHKFRRWRNYLKGIFDHMKVGKIPYREILVTGSARLEVYRFGGDSLQGRYHYARLLPLGLNELIQTHASLSEQREMIQSLMQYSGFPEPLLSQSETQLNRWGREYQARVIRDDVRDLESLKDLASVEILVAHLPACVGSPLSYNSLREQLQIAHKTVVNWVDVLEKLYLIFRIAPLGSPRIRAVKKEQKLYFFDWTRISASGGFRFENLVAVHLLKHVYWMQDSQGADLELRYFRDTDGREVDFIILENRRPKLMIECKVSDAPVSPHLKYLKAKFPECAAWQVHLSGVQDFINADGIRVAPVTELLKSLSC